MKTFHLEKEEAFPLSWEGDIILKRPCNFSEEEYHTYFNERMISLEDLNRYMSEPDFSIFHRVPVWVLKDEYKERIRHDILDGKKLSDADNIPKWTLDYYSKDEHGDYWNFEELKKPNKNKVVQWMLEPKNGICKGTTVGVAKMNYLVGVDEPVMKDGVLTGTITLECSPKPEHCEYVYDRQVSLRPTDKNGTFSTLPPKITTYMDHISDFAEEVCEEKLREEGLFEEEASLNDVLDSAESRVEEPQFYITDDYWER